MQRKIKITSKMLKSVEHVFYCFRYTLWLWWTWPKQSGPQWRRCKNTISKKYSCQHVAKHAFYVRLWNNYSNLVAVSQSNRAIGDYYALFVKTDNMALKLGLEWFQYNFNTPETVLNCKEYTWNGVFCLEL